MYRFEYYVAVFGLLLLVRAENDLPASIPKLIGGILKYARQPEKITTSCTGCPNNKVYEEQHVTEEELTALRIEYVKHQILRKLRLTEKPTVKLPLSDLPKPVTEDENLIPRNDDYFSEWSDDFYGRTTHSIMFPTEDKSRCPRKKRNPSACLPFQIKADIHPDDVSIAELWVYKESDNLDNHNQTFVVSEITHWDVKQNFLKYKPIAIHETSISEGWIQIDIAWAVKNWIEYHEPLHALNVICKTCGMNSFDSPISLNTTNRPFLVVYTHSQPRRLKRRTRRHANCMPGLNECCRENLYVSFEDIGWSNWIIHPPGFNAYFCKGSCSAAAAVTISGSHHNTILQKVRFGPKTRRLELVPCCAPTQFQDLQLVFTDNSTVQSKILPNMIVETCGCM